MLPVSDPKGNEPGRGSDSGNQKQPDRRSQGMSAWETYRDIIDLPYPTRSRHPRMPIGDRAAQFAPFAALTGFGAVLRETERITEKRIELDE